MKKKEIRRITEKQMKETKKREIIQILSKGLILYVKNENGVQNIISLNSFSEVKLKVENLCEDLY